MKTLLILRHAKSSWKNSDRIDDHDRPLNSRGKRDAPRMGKLLLEEGLIPDQIISSTARRARKTVRKLAKASGYAGEIQYAESLYTDSPEDCLDVIRRADDGWNSLLIVGHNPVLEELLEMLTGRNEVLPTAALAVVRLGIDSWKELKPSGRGILENLWRPRELPPEIE